MQFEVKAKYDVIIVGSGISGLICAIELSKAGKAVCLLSKEAITEGSSIYAQGGIAIPLDSSDSVEKHLEDTLKAGAGLSNIEVAKEIISSSNSSYEKLISYGVKFDTSTGSKPHLTKEAAHSYARVCHAGGDATGRFVIKTLIDRVCRDPNISIAQGTMVISILKDNAGAACGVLVEDITKDKFAMFADDVIVASGGAGQLFELTTNPKVSTGDGIVMAHRIGACLQDVEMIQFHPTVLIEENKDPLLITEAIRGEGARLRNTKGDYFAHNYHKDGELAPRDILARAILNEIKKTDSKFVYLDVSNFTEDYFKSRFPTIYEACLERKIDLFNLGIPVAPAAHYFIGGIQCEVTGKTNVSNLWAVGECASSGFHGANRLASNSLLECIVVPHILAREIVKRNERAVEAGFKPAGTKPAPNQESKLENCISLNIDDSSFDENEIKCQVKELQKRNLISLGLLRNEKTIINHLKYLETLSEKYKVEKLSSNSQAQEFKNMIYLSVLISKAAWLRKESLGVHYREDFPGIAMDKKHSIFALDDSLTYKSESTENPLVKAS
jgi:L-aspartate oxidase